MKGEYICLVVIKNIICCSVIKDISTQHVLVNTSHIVNWKIGWLVDKVSMDNTNCDTTFCYLRFHKQMFFDKRIIKQKQESGWLSMLYYISIWISLVIRTQVFLNQYKHYRLVLALICSIQFVGMGSYGRKCVQYWV